MTDSLQATIRTSGQSLYGIAKATGLNKATLGRFMAGKNSLRLDKADKLATHFKLTLKKDR